MCHRLKTHCEWVDGEGACAQCMRKGQQDNCEPQESSTCSVCASSVPPNLSFGEQSAPNRRQHAHANSAHDIQKVMQKCSSASVDIDMTQVKWHHATSCDHTQANSASFTVDLNVGTMEFLSVLLSNFQEDPKAEEDSKVEVEDFHAEMDCVSVGPSDNSDSDGQDDRFLKNQQLETLKILQKKPEPVRSTTGKAKAILKHIKGNLKSYADDSSPPVFMIPCFIMQPNRTFSPFKIDSNCTFDNLCIEIRWILCVQPGLLHLQYHLDSKGTKQIATSLQSEKELESFMKRLCDLIVPPALSSGKPSNHPHKHVPVYFEDSALTGDNAMDAPVAKAGLGGKGNSQLVCTIFLPVTGLLQREIVHQPHQKGNSQELNEEPKLSKNSNCAGLMKCTDGTVTIDKMSENMLSQLGDGQPKQQPLMNEWKGGQHQ
ncbi:hypothetical protein EDC04DRAFT_2599354 [Pisolithus marmoratus]|nr:hypothetical protein EDC04DRAFT_2599354 [Pisolithus marmoratus]